MSDSVPQAPRAADGPPAVETLTNQPSLPDRPSTPEVPPYRVLIVDDYQDDRELLKEWLEETSHFVVIGEAPDGPRGVALAAQLRPDLVTLDMSMPGGFGEAVTQMDQMTQHNAALVEESAAAAESLKAQAQELVAAVGVLLFVPSTGPTDRRPLDGAGAVASLAGLGLLIFGLSEGESLGWWKARGLIRPISVKIISRLPGSVSYTRLPEPAKRSSPRDV